MPSKDWPTRGEVQFKNLKVRYREGLDLALKGLDIFVEGGQKVVIEYKMVYVMWCVSDCIITQTKQYCRWVSLDELERENLL